MFYTPYLHLTYWNVLPHFFPGTNKQVAGVS